MRGMVCAPQPLAVEEGVKVLQKGGNAVDAAVTASLVQGVTDPQMCGLGGLGTMHALVGGVHYPLDFYATAPAACTEDMWAEAVVAETHDGFGFLLEGEVNDVGYQAVATPGYVRGVAEALARWGTLSWDQALAPARRIAEEGFMVPEALAKTWRAASKRGQASMPARLGATPEARRIYLKENGEPREAGEHLALTDYAATLRRLAEAGPQDFYRGHIARRIDEDMRAGGGLLRAEDLDAYRLQPGALVENEYRGCRVVSNQPPGGGLVVLEILAILEHFDLKRLGHNTAEYIRVVSEAMKYAAVDRGRSIGDPAFDPVDAKEILDPARIAAYARSIEAGEIAHVERLKPGDPGGTTHICTLDARGNAVSFTHTLGQSSGVITPGLGFMYNNFMAGFDPRPGRLGSIKPGKRRFSGMCPTMVYRAGELYLVVGAPGGTNIPLGVLQAILNAVDFGMSATEAVYAPRFACHGEAIELEGRIPGYTAAELEGKGYRVARQVSSYGTVARVHAIMLEGGRASGAADPSGGGMALGA